MEFMTRRPARYPHFRELLTKVGALAALTVFFLWCAPVRANGSSTAKKRATVRKGTARRVVHHYYHHYHRRYRRPWLSTYLADPGSGDDSQFDDPVVRQAALEALGQQNGTVVAVDPSNGRILSIVNQKLAYSAGFEPCSTLKPVIAIAALENHIITPDTMIRVSPRRYMNLTEALAHSNNEFFQTLGGRLGFQTVWHYDHLFGLGQRAGLGIGEEQPGILPAAPPHWGGVERMCSFGEGIRMTPLQLASIVATIANGGTEYYLQYPQTEEAVHDFQPRVRRTLAIAPLLPDLRRGMLAAVLYGTARQSNDPDGAQALGKTGTCDDPTMGGRLGWFASYAGESNPKIVLVVLLRGLARIVNGPHAADIAGKIYRQLDQQNYFVSAPAASGTSSAANSSER